MCTELLGRLSTCEPAFVAQIARLVSKAGHRPPAGWMAVFLEEAALRLPAFGPEHLVLLLEALAAWRYRPGPALQRRLEAAAAARLPAFSAAQLARLLAGLRALGWRLRHEGAVRPAAHGPRGAEEGRGLSAAASLEVASGKLRWAAAADVAALLPELAAALEAAGWAAGTAGGGSCLVKLQAALPRHLAAMAPQQRVAAAAALARLRLLVLGPGHGQEREQALPAPLAGCLAKQLAAAERSGQLGEPELQQLARCRQALGLRAAVEAGSRAGDPVISDS